MGPNLKKNEEISCFEEQFGGLKLLILPQSSLRRPKTKSLKKFFLHIEAQVFLFFRTENTWIRIRIDLKGWIRIRIETNADPQHWFMYQLPALKKDDAGPYPYKIERIMIFEAVVPDGSS